MHLGLVSGLHWKIAGVFKSEHFLRTTEHHFIGGVVHRPGPIALGIFERQRMLDRLGKKRKRGPRFGGRKVFRFHDCVASFNWEYS